MKNKMRFVGFILCLCLAGMCLTACEKMSDVQKSSLAGAQGERIEPEGVNEVLLYEANALSLTMQAVKSSEGSRKSYTLYISNGQEQEMVVQIDHIVVNHTYVLTTPEVFFIDSLEDAKVTMEELTELAYAEHLDGINAMCFHISIRDASYEIIDEQDINLDFEEKLVFELDYHAFLDAKAEKQVLLDDEHAKITLMAWGRNTDNNYIETVVCIENKSEETIPAMISGMNVNGIFFKTAESVNFLKPGQKCYANTYVLVSDFVNKNITSISSIDLMIMTDEQQNTGSVSYSGGEWYSVELTQKGEVNTAFVTGEILETLEDVEISYLGQTEKVWSDHSGFYTWNLAVVNESDENIKVAIIDVLVDGMPEDTWDEQTGDCSLYIADSEVGAHSNRQVQISLSYYDEKIERPELSFRLQLRSMAGGAVIATGEEVITITPEQ